MSDVKKVLEMIKEEDVKFVDFRFTDPKGKWQHTAQHVSTIDEEVLEEGIMFDGSSIEGWKTINESDMVLKPDCSTAVIDPFAAQKHLIIICDILEPATGLPYDRDPRSMVEKAVAYMKSTGVADTCYVGPEAEFFVFDDVRFQNRQNSTFYEIDSEEGAYVTGKKIDGGNSAHRPRTQGGYFPVPPVDSGTDFRAEMLTVMETMGVPVEKHHHEVAPSQHELGFKFLDILKAGDIMQIYKYVVHNVAHDYGKTATFMPKPIIGDNGSGMHVHQSLWKDGKPLFAGNRYADLSETALYYIGGIIKHAKALNAITNASTNSYKRLVPGFEAPVLLAYSASNRSASIRIPYGSSPKAKRVEVRFPDPTANPYLAFAAMLMAGLDGIENKINPGDPMDKNLYDLPPEELQDVPVVCGSLREALQALDEDRDFLKKGDVFTDDAIDGYLDVKWEEVIKFEQATHPIEFEMYYSV
ncbi:MAG: type I glutamate--ammonia ligase [Alphaproteobacteria bacterium]|nr:type I glutamate--ammonia ligase [Alphaproteobacteria bacterium]